MDAIVFTVVGGALLLYGLVSRRAEGSILSPPMVFTAVGFAASSAAAGLVDFKLDRELVHLLAEVTLVLVLFTDASRIELSLLRREHSLPVRLLGVGLPLTILVGGLIAWAMFPALGVWGALVLAVVLAPTDAALGQATVSSERVPVRIRQALNVESGLNDGIALPILLLFLSVTAATGGAAAGGAAHGAAGNSPADWAVFGAMQIGLGPVAGAAVGWIGAVTLRAAYKANTVSLVFLKLSALALAVCAFGVAELIHGNGFIAAFVAGLVMGNVARDICFHLYEFGEAEGQLLALLTFLVFGGLMVPSVIDVWDWQMLGYALLSLTVIRLVPVWLSLMGAGMHPLTTLFLGWFGPRGIASILYGLLILGTTAFPGQNIVIGTMVLTVLLSVVLHGVTAAPLAALYGRQLRKMEAAGREMPEDLEVSEMPLRLHWSRHQQK